MVPGRINLLCMFVQDVMIFLKYAQCFSLGTLSSIPTALTRWTDECKVLDAESMHDCVAGKSDQ